MILEHARYETGERLGGGAQGTVVRVVDRERPSARLVAKIPSATAPSALASLEGEFALLARLRIPGLVRVHDYARDARGTPFLVEEYVEGHDPLRWVTAAQGASAFERLVRVAVALAETLALLHDAGFVHGDVKPSNIVVEVAEHGEERVVLLDLGAAASARATPTPTRLTVGVHTPAFAAPELAAGVPPSVATDLHALGATLVACACGTGGMTRRGRTSLRDHAPWVSPRVASVIERLVADHPSDRPADAREVLRLLGRAGIPSALSAPRRRGSGGWESGARGEHIREAELRTLIELAAAHEGRVVYVAGPSGAGKSHMLRELSARLLLAGHEARAFTFPTPAEVALRRLRETETADAPPIVLILDDLHAASQETRDAVDAFRCRPSRSPTLVVAAVREAPPGAHVIAIGPLDEPAFARFAEGLGGASSPPSSLFREAAGLPGWAVAALGRVPLHRDALLSRIAMLGDAPRAALALVATLGGSMPASFATNEDLAPLFVAGLLERTQHGVRLATPALACDIEATLGSFAVSDRAADRVLASTDEARASSASALLAVASASSPPSRRDELLAEAARRARAEGARTTEIDALLALVASPLERNGARLARLERLTRDAGIARAHPQVLVWLGEAAERDPSLAPLAARRRAEERARAGDHEGALKEATAALAIASQPAEKGHALATRGAVLLFAARWEDAERSLLEARAVLASADGEEATGATARDERDERDEEERARFEHNLGVVLLYRGRADAAADAFDRSLAIKRALGDRAGVRACLLNLGLASTRLGRFGEAEAALVEATRLADLLGQAAGRAWCLAAHAELEVKRRRPREAEALVAEAEATGDALPKPVRADLTLLRSEIALLEGDGPRARAALAAIDDALRRDDALVDARALVLVAKSWLSSLPVDRRASARAAIAAARRARGAALDDVVRDALATLREARGVATEEPAPMERRAARGEGEEEEAAVWTIIEALANGEAQDGLRALASHVLEASGAERVFVAAIDEDARVLEVWGQDLDGLAIAEAASRIDAGAVSTARRRGAPVYVPDSETRASGTRATSATRKGSRLTTTGVRSAIVVEHRFQKRAFDHVTEAEARQWAMLADVAVRLALHASSRASSTASSSSSSSASVSASATARAAYSTALPLRAPARDYPEILGRSPALRRALAQLDAAVETDLPVLVSGETGTGKELFARALHDQGARAARPFVAVNCAAIADALFEAELFGHARGAFTGADRARPGLLARAEGGTLLLDEIGELPLARQATLLRALESKRYRAVGSDDERAFDVRIVAATNRDLDAAANDGSFRMDLLYRLRVLDITVPPLRERAGDVELLLRQFLTKAGSRARVSPAALDALEAYAFPGNVRELVHVAQRLAAGKVDEIGVANLPRAVRSLAPSTGVARAAEGGPEEEKAEVLAALDRTGGNISRAATLLGITRHGLKKRMLRLGLRARAGGES